MTTIDHQHPKVVFEPVLGRWRVEYRTQWTDEWQTHRYHHTLEEACADAQEMTNNDLDGAYRVVDTQPEEVATGRRTMQPRPPLHLRHATNTKKARTETPK